MRIFTLISLVTVVIFSATQQGYAQITNQYKIVFEQSLTEETKVFLQKLSKSADVIYNATENSAIISIASSIDNNILSGKLEKLKASVKSIDLMDNEVNINTTKNSTTIPTQTEIENKAAKSQQLQLQRNNKPIPSTPYKRY